MRKPISFPRGIGFPAEGFVQKALEAHFARLGFDVIEGGHADLCVRHPMSGERWLIEAKGKTTAVGLDFRTGLGQLIQRHVDPAVRAAVAVPKIDAFLRQIDLVPEWLRAAVGLWWLVVDEQGVVHPIPPSQTSQGAVAKRSE